MSPQSYTQAKRVFVLAGTFAQARLWATRAGVRFEAWSFISNARVFAGTWEPEVVIVGTAAERADYRELLRELAGRKAKIRREKIP